MTIASNLSLRLAAIMLVGFVLLQALIAAVAAPSGEQAASSYLGLPRPEEAAAIATAIERAPIHQRGALVDALDGGALYSLRLVHFSEQNWQSPGQLEDIARRYSAAMPGRPVRLAGRRPRLSEWIGEGARLARILAPTSVLVGLKDETILVISSQPSDELRAFQKRRALIGASGGLVLLIILMLAVRQTTRPLSLLAGGVRRFAADLDAPDLSLRGPGEVRELAAALNDMKAEMRGLIAERTRVLGAIAHDLRTYLTRLRLRAEFIGDDRHRACAIRDLDEMTALVNDTLFLADRDTAPLSDPRPIPLMATLREIVHSHLEFGHSVVLDPVADDVVLAATPLALRRVLDNLIGNGLRHGSKVTVRVRSWGSFVDIVVEDDGPGVPIDALSRLGLPFQRFDPSRSRETGGAGLGLAIVRALAERDEAIVLFEQASPHGLRVTLRYPRA